MNKQVNFSSFFIVIIILFFIIDLSQFFLGGATIVSLLLSLYCLFLLYDIHSPFLNVIALLQCLESFCFYNNPLLPLLYFVPITYSAAFMQKNFYHSFLYYIVFLSACLGTQLYLIEPFLLGIIPRQDYTLTQISATLAVGICFSLTIKYWGKQDNRA